MAKNTIAQYSATASSNTDVANIDIDEGMAPSNVNNAMRAIMGHLKDMDVGTSALTSPNFTAFKIGGTTITATGAELNFVDGVTSNIQTQLNSKLSTLALSDLGVTATAAELNKLDGATVTTAEINYNDVTTLGTSQASKVVTADANGDVKFSNSTIETVFILTGTALDPNNGTMQVKTLSSNVTFTDSLSSGESMSLSLINGSSHTVTFPTITWVSKAGNNAPTLTANDTLVFYKISSTLYGVYVGSSA
jgi:hypothetical protein